MSDLIPSITIENFKKLEVSEIRNLKALEVTDNGEFIFTAVIPHGDFSSSDYVRIQAEYLSVKANMVGGVDPEVTTEVICEECGKPCASEFGLKSHMRSHEVKENATV